MNPEPKEMMPVREEPRTLTLNPEVSLAEVQQARKNVLELIQKGLKRNIDFGQIPGTQKDTMYQPGAQQVASWFNCMPDYRILSEEHNPTILNEYEQEEKRWDNSKRKMVKTGKSIARKSRGHHAYRIQCNLIHRPSGQIVGAGLGSCSTDESKYIDRPNDLDNTVFKMGKKRAYVDAVLNTFALSDRFTQDMEDIVPEEVIEATFENVNKDPIPLQKKEAERFIKKEVSDSEVEQAREKFRATGMTGSEIKQTLKDLIGDKTPEQWTRKDYDNILEFLGSK